MSEAKEDQIVVQEAEALVTEVTLKVSGSFYDDVMADPEFSVDLSEIEQSDRLFEEALRTPIVELEEVITNLFALPAVGRMRPRPRKQLT